jgi:molecular chaperone DnaK (HSP70)
MVTLLLLMVLSFVCAQENHNPALGIDLGNEWMKFAIVNPDGKV